MIKRIKKFFSKNEYLLLALPFLLLLIFQFFLPVNPIQDEKGFYANILAIGKNYLPSIEQIKCLQSPMGPFFFVFYGFIGKLFGFNIIILRIVNVLLSFGIAVLLFKLYKKYLKDYFRSVLWFILNPYFFLLTSPLIYTDNLNLLLIIAGVYLYYLEDKKLIAAVFFGLAAWTRQFSLLFPAAILVAESLSEKRLKNIDIKKYFALSVPFLMFLPLFLLWGGHVTSDQHPGGAFVENTLAAFKFSPRAVSYSLLIYGLFLLPVLAQLPYRKIFNKLKTLTWTGYLLLVPIILGVFKFFDPSANAAAALYGYETSRLKPGVSFVPWHGYVGKILQLFNLILVFLIPLIIIFAIYYFYNELIIKKSSGAKKNIFFALAGTLFFVVFAFPRFVNINANYSHALAGYLDRIIVTSGWLAYLYVPVILFFSLYYFISVFFRPNRGSIMLFSKTILFLFIVFESIYSYCWDKHYLQVLPFLFLIDPAIYRKKKK